MLYCVYKHTNLVNNKVYIGQTNNPDRRWRNNGIEYGNTIFGQAIKKYGWNNFTHEILEDNLTKEEADIREEYYIQLYDSINNGYNTRHGGSNGALSESAKEKISQAQKERGAWAGDKNPRHINPLYGERNGMYGKHHSEETKKKISMALQGRTISEEQKQSVSNFMSNNHPRAKKVKCLETGKIFKSAREASRAIGGKDGGSISRVCRGERPSYLGYHFEWYEENK